MYKCKYFTIKELVSPKVYKKRGDKAWSLFDDRILKVADLLREHFGSAIINDWSWKGSFKNSGFRTSFSQWFRMFSQHTFGRALDMKFSDQPAFIVRKELIDNWETTWKEKFNEIGVSSITLECGDKITWVHIDIRNAPEGVNTFWVN